MNRQPCELIQDILPLYVEDSVSNTTKEIIFGHLQECPSCQELVNQLRMPDPVLPDLKESLPDVDTFKKWLKRIKTIGISVLALIILGVVGIGVVSYKAGSAAQKDILSLRDVTQTVERAGFDFTVNSTVNPEDYKMGQVKPSIYHVNNFDGILFIYHFANMEELDSNYDQWEKATRNKNVNNSSYINMFSAKWPYNRAYAAKNTIIVIGLSQIPNNLEDFQKISPVLTKLDKAIFYNLNEGQQIVYQGEGQNWKGKVIINYYNHFWKDDKGVLQYDGWNHSQPVLEFKGDPNSVKGQFSYEFKSSLDKFSGSDANGFDARMLSERDTSGNYGGIMLGFGGLNGGGAMPPKEEVYTVTVKWNNQQENFELKASE